MKLQHVDTCAHISFVTSKPHSKGGEDTGKKARRGYAASEISRRDLTSTEL